MNSYVFHIVPVSSFLLLCHETHSNTQGHLLSRANTAAWWVMKWPYLCVQWLVFPKSISSIEIIKSTAHKGGFIVGEICKQHIEQDGLSQTFTRLAFSFFLSINLCFFFSPLCQLGSMEIQEIFFTQETQLAGSVELGQISNLTIV